MTTYLGKSCPFSLPRVPFVNCRQFMYLVISLLVLRAGCGIWLYQFLIIAYLFTFLREDLSSWWCRMQRRTILWPFKSRQLVDQGVKPATVDHWSPDASDRWSTMSVSVLTIHRTSLLRFSLAVLGLFFRIQVQTPTAELTRPLFVISVRFGNSQ